MEWISKLFDINKLPFKIVFLAAMVSGIIAFAPEVWLQKLQLLEFKKSYGIGVGVVFLTSFGLTATNVVIYIFEFLRRAYRRAQWKAHLTNRLRNLDNSEQAVLREFYILGRHTIDIPINDSTVAGLMNKGIIQVTGQHGERSLSGILWPCTLNDEAQKRITNNMVGLPDGEPTQNEWDQIRKSRPYFVSDLETRDFLRRL